MYGTKIRILRDLRRLSQESVAAQLGISQDVYSKIENNHRKIDDNTLQQLATILGVSVSDIKNPDPFILNLQNSSQSANFNNEVNYNINDKLLEQLTFQLAEKDRQIEKLLALLAERKK
ncbi:MAG: helix-turn-helix domain-containing protein [Chitinophagaceae bacterium]|jgi:transcriptional regulator with XRE-family HTH domain|nr:helix-turn-helix domain-containing protein [Chitinophagaceae bacterium]